MGRKKRSKHKALELAMGKKVVQPDDYFSLGPIEMARFGRMGVIRNRLSKEQFETMQDRHAELFPKVCREIDQKVSEIVEMIKQHSPEELLKRGYWEIVGHYVKSQKDKRTNKDDPLPLRMVDYVQSIIVSVPSSGTVYTEVSENQWQRLRKLVDALFTQFNLEYQICRTAFARKNNPEYNEDFDEYYVKAQMYWCTVRGHRYSAHEIPYLHDVLTPHDEIIQELFGISVAELLESFKNIFDSLSRGVIKAGEELRKFQTVTTPILLEKIEKAGDVKNDDLPRLMEEVIKENQWEEWRNDVLGRFFGSDLFNLQKITTIPEVLLKELSWEPGQDKEFFEGDSHKGWPLKAWPVFKRPFIKIDGYYFCFELHSLFDNIYRVLQRIVTGRKPEYGPIWNIKQKAVSEELPIELFRKLLPGAEIYHSVYYRWHTGSNLNIQWCEADALIVYEDHLFVLEVKAGAFTYTPPATDFPAYIESLKNLVLKPSEQGKRFLDYLNSEDEVGIFDVNHVEVARIKRKSFEYVTICAVTLDAFTELAAQVQHLRRIGIDVGHEPVWSVSIDDLRVYTDVFDNPLVFLHFVEQRMRAFRSDFIQTDDELDHLGLYLAHNVYTEYAKDFNFDKPITWHGYRTKIDDFFSEKLWDSTVMCPLKQEMPTRLKEIVDFLATCQKSGRRKVASALLDTGGSWRNSVASGIDEILQEQSLTLRAKPLSTHGGENITLFCWQHGFVERDKNLALDHVKASMLITGEEKRLLIELIFNRVGGLTDVDFNFVALEDIASWDADRLRAKAEIIRKKRIGKAKQSGKIGRNQPCPCGSGKKYKKCCLLIKT